MRAVRIVLIIFGVFALIAGALYVMRLPVAGFVVRSAMNAQGFSKPTARVTALSLDQVSIANISAQSPVGKGFEFERIDVAFNFREAFLERRVKKLDIAGGVLRAELTETGTLQIRGLENFVRGEPGPLPFDTLSVNTGIAIDTPAGLAKGKLRADYNLDIGGKAAVNIHTDEAGFEDLSFQSAEAELIVVFRDDGVFEVGGDFQARKVSTNTGVAGAAAIEFSGNGSSWHALAAGDRNDIAATGALRVVNIDAAITDNPRAEQLMRSRGAILFGGPMSQLNFSGDVKFNYGPDGFVAMFGEEPLSVRADTGAELVFAEQFDTPLVEMVDGGAAIALAYAVKGGDIEAVGSVNVETAGKGWYAFAPVRVRAYESEALTFRDASASVQINGDARQIAAELTTKIDLRSAKVGRLSVIDAPFATKFLVAADLEQNIVEVTIPDEQCIGLERARFAIEQQDMDASIKDAQLCVDERPLIRTHWDGALFSEFDAIVTGQQARYRLGQTRLSGKPPRVSLSGKYRPAENTTIVVGELNGGAFTLNDALNLNGVDGNFEFQLNADVLQATTKISDVKITQAMDTPLVAPVFADLNAQLADREVVFSFDLRSQDGLSIGGGEGEHDINTGRGSSRLLFTALQFQPDGLQPDRLAPVLKGVIGTTTGQIAGNSTFSWSPGETNSSADLSFVDITFEGPTRVVNSTTNLNGGIKFTSLWPATTDGPQTITVDAVDLDALQLNEGSVEFNLPGDETLRITEATFPWFGGVLGVYGANASIAGDQAVAPLRAEHIDLKQVLEYVDVEGLSGEGILSGTLPLVVEDGRARIENGVLKSEGPGAIRYAGQAAAKASEAGGDQTKIAFDILRNLEYDTLGVSIDGPLDGRLDFELRFEGKGEVSLSNQDVRVPVIYRINLDAALLELLNQANLSRNIQLQVERAIQENL